MGREDGYADLLAGCCPCRGRRRPEFGEAREWGAAEFRTAPNGVKDSTAELPHLLLPQPLLTFDPRDPSQQHPNPAQNRAGCSRTHLSKA